MKANEISIIIDQYETMPYKCIFFDGEWGIGKTYAAKHVKTKDSVWVSLCGIRSAEELYRELNDGFVLKHGITDAINRTFKVTAKAVSSIPISPAATGIASEVLSNTIMSKTMLGIFLSKMRKKRIVVIDDFERVSDEIDIAEVFRVIDFLKSQQCIKVFVLGNLNRLNSEIKNKYDHYSERYIDKTYHIDKYADTIKWNEIGLDDGFINEFCSYHNVKNLRSIIKAQLFYKDITNQLNDEIGDKEENEQFWKELRLTAFAIVIESNDNIYKPQSETQNSKSELTQQEKAAEILRLSDRSILNRISRQYLQNTRYGHQFCEVLWSYYNDNELHLDVLEAIYKQPQEDNSIILFLSDEKEVRKKIIDMITVINDSNNLDEIIIQASTYVAYSQILGESDQIGIDKLKQRMNNLLFQLYESGKIDIHHTEHYEYISGGDRVRRVVHNAIGELNIHITNDIVQNICRGVSSEDSLEMSNKLIEIKDNPDLKNILLKYYDKLLSENIFPIEIKTENQYYASKNILKVLYNLNCGRLENFYIELMNRDIDLIAKHRCKCIMDEITGK